MISGTNLKDFSLWVPHHNKVEEDEGRVGEREGQTPST